MGVWDDLDESEISRPEILFQSDPAVTDGVLVPLACLVGDTSFPAISST